MLIPFRKKVNAVGWRSDELAECYRVVGLLARSGLPVSIDSGLTDEGEPWAIVLREDTGDVLLHMARLDGAFVVVSAAGPVAQRGESLRAVLDTAVRTGGLAMLTRHSAAADSEILRLHPATLIAAFIASAWVHTQTSQAALLETSARREEGGPSRIDDARLAGFAALPAAAALATAAASFAAVAATLHTTQADPALEVTPEDFIQAALDLVAEVDGKAPLSVASIELSNLELSQDGPLISAPMMGEPSPSEAQPDDAPTPARLDAVVSAAPVSAPGAGDILRSSGQQLDGAPSSGLSWDAAHGHFLAIGPLGTTDFMPAEAAQSLLVTTLSSSAEGSAPASRPAAETPAPAQHTPAAEPPPLPVQPEEAAPIVRATLPATVDEAPSHQTYSWDIRDLIFKNAAQILHLDIVVTQTGSEARDHSDENSDVVPATSQVTPVPASVDTGGALSSSAGSFAPAGQGGTLPKTEPSAPDVGGGGKPLTAAVQPPPPSNAQLLLEFTNGAEHVVHVGRNELTGPLHGQLETGNASKVVVIDAPWLEVKSFMLMPGVMMMEDDLLGGVNRAGMEMKGSPVSLDLGDGLTIKLLGVLDLGLT